MKELQSRVSLVAEVLKSSLENFNLYIAVDAKTKEFIFIDRCGYDAGTNCKTARVKMEEINIRK